MIYPQVDSGGVDFGPPGIDAARRKQVDDGNQRAEHEHRLVTDSVPDQPAADRDRN